MTLINTYMIEVPERGGKRFLKTMAANYKEETIKTLRKTFKNQSLEGGKRLQQILKYQLIADICNLSYLAGWGRKMASSRPFWQFRELLSHKVKRAGALGSVAS